MWSLFFEVLLLMGYMNFKNPLLEKVFKEFKWSRNNTVQLFEIVIKSESLNYKPSYNKENPKEDHNMLLQFQCMVTTTDTYFRKITNDKNKSYGILIDGDEVIKKSDLQPEKISNLLKSYISKLETALKSLSDKEAEKAIKYLVMLQNHEYLHQGQLVVMFREVGLEFPHRFKTAWDL